MTSIEEIALRNDFEDWPVLIKIQFNCISDWDINNVAKDNVRQK